jgi:hypothetical protein
MAGMSALLRMTAGLTLWAIAFCLLYGLHGIGCARGWATIAVAGTSLHRAALAALWIACLAAGAALVARSRPHRHAQALVDRAAFPIALIGLVATLFTGLPILLLPACL